MEVVLVWLMVADVPWRGGNIGYVLYSRSANSLAHCDATLASAHVMVTLNLRILLNINNYCIIPLHCLHNYQNNLAQRGQRATRLFTLSREFSRLLTENTFLW